MTKLIGVAIIALLGYGVFALWEVWDKYNRGQDLKEQEALKTQVKPENLPGITYQLEQAYEKASQRGAPGIRDWLNAYQKDVQDPRLAWIQLDYVVAVSQENPAEARQVFAEVKARVTKESPVYQRVKDLEKTYD